MATKRACGKGVVADEASALQDESTVPVLLGGVYARLSVAGEAPALQVIGGALGSW